MANQIIQLWLWLWLCLFSFHIHNLLWLFRFSLSNFQFCKPKLCIFAEIKMEFHFIRSLAVCYGSGCHFFDRRLSNVPLNFNQFFLYMLSDVAAAAAAAADEVSLNIIEILWKENTFYIGIGINIYCIRTHKWWVKINDRTKIIDKSNWINNSNAILIDFMIQTDTYNGKYNVFPLQPPSFFW